MAINLEKGIRLADRMLMKKIFDNLLEKEPTTINEVVKELCSYEDTVIVDIESSEKLLKSKKQIFITFYSNNDKTQLFNLTIVVYPTKEGELVLDGITITDKNTLKALSCVF